MHRWTVFFLSLFAWNPSNRALAQQPAAAMDCRAPQAIGPVAELREWSGLAASRRVPGRFWAHNDSGEPVLVALDANGTVTGRLRLMGARVEDWEAIAVGPCGDGSCIYVGDIGDNAATRGSITVYRIAEPAAPASSAAVEAVIQARYPDGAHDAEALLVTQDGRLHVVTKGETGPIALYRFPADARSGTIVQLERVGNPRASRGAGAAERVTDAAVSADGRWVALRTGEALTFHRASELLAGNWRAAGQVDLRPLGEPQGEAVAFGPDNTVYLAGEGGGRSQAGTFARMRCTERR